MGARWIALIAGLAGCDRVFALEEPELPGGDWAEVAAGDRHTCGIRLDGTLWCWGANESNQLGSPVLEAAVPVQISGASWRAISSRSRHTCAIRDDETLWCWGYNSLGQLGAGDTDIHRDLVQVPGTWRQVATGTNHTCAIDAATHLWCWGQNNQGQAGDGTAERVQVPTEIAGAGWVRVAAHLDHTCGIRDDDSLWCWGTNNAGQLAAPTAASQLAPHRSTGSWTDVAVGAGFTCAIATDGRLRCWGSNTGGQLGNGTTSSARLGTPVGGDEDGWVALAAGERHVCARRSDETLRCWGANERGQVPSEKVGSVASLPTEIDVRGVPGYARWEGGWLRIALGTAHTCAIDDGHRLWCAGFDATGQLGRGTVSHLTPVRVPGTWRSVGAGEHATCALDADGAAWCWGENEDSQLGDGSALSRQLPTPVAADGPWEALTVGPRGACVRRGDEHVCWGDNNEGQIGDGTRDDVFLPSVIAGGRWPVTASYHACSIDADADLWCWGRNQHGQVGLGHNDPNVITSPVALSVAGPWTVVATGENHTCGVAGGVVYCWGRNGDYQVGDGTQDDRNAPVQVDLGGADALELGHRNSCLLRGTQAWCWGSNHLGELGLGGNVLPMVPTPLPGAWRQLSLAADHGCGVGDDGGLACWGVNTDGKLGDGTIDRRTSAVQVGTDTDWVQVATGSYHACARKADDSLWCWGSNARGALGDGTAWSSALQVVK